MTNAQFEKLPLLLQARDMRLVTGLNKDGLRGLREANPQIVAERRGRRILYAKAEVAKMVKLKG